MPTPSSRDAREDFPPAVSLLLGPPCLPSCLPPSSLYSCVLCWVGRSPFLMRFDDSRFFRSRCRPPAAAGTTPRTHTHTHTHTVHCCAIQLHRRCGKQTCGTRERRKAEWEREWPDKNRQTKPFFAFIIRLPFCLRTSCSVSPPLNVESPSF